jgi:hypothetical protein
VFEIIGADASSLNDGEQCALLLVSAVERNRLDAAECRLLADWDARKVWAADGALSGAAWLRNRLGCSTSWAWARLRVARRLRHMPLTTAAFESGELSLEKVRLLTGIRTDATAAAFDQFEATLVDCARRFDTGELAKITGHWKAAADAAGFADDTKLQRDGQQAWLSKTLAGMYELDGTFAPEDGQVVETELDRLMDKLYRQEQRDIEAGLDVPIRTRAQRRAAAIVEMARRSAAGTGTRRVRPEVGVVLSLETLLGGDQPGRLSDGTPLAPEAARRLACDADIIRILTGARSEILDLGRRTPNPNNGQRCAVALRDVGCTFAGCDMPSNRCEIHHLVPYARGSTTGGPTDLDNLTLVCSRHHHLVHEGGFKMSRNPHTGHIETHKPDGTPLPTRPRAGPLTPQPGARPPDQPATPKVRAADPEQDQLDLHEATGPRATDRESDRNDPDAATGQTGSDAADPERGAKPLDPLLRQGQVRDDPDDGSLSQAS